MRDRENDKETGAAARAIREAAKTLHIDGKGMPTQKRTGVPGDGSGTTVGTPKYIKAAAERAERHVSEFIGANGGGKQEHAHNHRVSSSHYSAGKPPRGKFKDVRETPEKIRSRPKYLKD